LRPRWVGDSPHSLSCSAGRRGVSSLTWRYKASGARCWKRLARTQREERGFEGGGWPTKQGLAAMRGNAGPDRPSWMFASLRGLRADWLPHDLIAGLLLTTIAVPEQLATARLAGLPPETGLIAFVAGSLAFPIFGANRFLSLGADSTIAPIFAGGLAALAATGTAEYAHLASLLALMVGAILIVAA